MRRNRPEELIQRAVAAYLNKAMPAASFWFAVANQKGTRKRFEMGILKALGAKAGVPDICILWSGRFIGIELKAPKGRLSGNQESASQQITLAGGLYSICRSVEEVESFLRMIGLPLRATVLPAKPNEARPIGEIIKPIMADILAKTTEGAC